MFRAVEGGEDIVGILYRQNFFFRAEEGIQSQPPIRKNRSAAGRRLEEASGGAVAGARHTIASDIQGCTRRRVKRCVVGRRDVIVVRYILRPLHRPWVKRAGENKARIRPAFRGSQKQSLQFVLAVRRVSSHIAEITLELRPGGSSQVKVGIHTTIERASAPRMPHLFEFLEDSAAGKR